MADRAPSRAGLPAVAPEAALVESIKVTSGATAGRTVVLSEKKEYKNSRPVVVSAFGKPVQEVHLFDLLDLLDKDIFYSLKGDGLHSTGGPSLVKTLLETYPDMLPENFRSQYVKCAKSKGFTSPSS